VLNGIVSACLTHRLGFPTYHQRVRPSDRDEYERKKERLGLTRPATLNRDFRDRTRRGLRGRRNSLATWPQPRCRHRRAFLQSTMLPHRSTGATRIDHKMGGWVLSGSTRAAKVMDCTNTPEHTVRVETNY